MCSLSLQGVGRQRSELEGREPAGVVRGAEAGLAHRAVPCIPRLQPKPSSELTLLGPGVPLGTRWHLPGSIRAEAGAAATGCGPRPDSAPHV